MSRHSEDREDLMRDARALEPRVELILPGDEEPIVIGRRRDGFISIYVGQDPVYHWDEQGRLRRAFVEGLLYRSEGETLSRLTRQHSEHVSELHRRDLDPGELAQFLSIMKDTASRISGALKSGAYRVTRSVPDQLEGYLPDVIQYLDGVVVLEHSLSPKIK